MIKENSLALIGNTQLLKLESFIGGGRNLYAKLEHLQPGGSVKARAAYQIITDAYESGILFKGRPVVEMTSGNMGSGLAVVCSQFGNPFTAVMSKGNSPERIRFLKALGASVLLTDQIDGKPGMVTGKDITFASEMAKNLAKEQDGFYVDQFNNPSSIVAHYNTTGPEIWRDLPSLDAFVTCVGSGGTFIGTSKYLKEQNPKIACIAVEPKQAAILKTGKVVNQKHIIQGTGYSLVPPHWDTKLVDNIETVSDLEVDNMTRRLARDTGLYVGYSSGANVLAAVKYMKYNPGKTNVVTILCDTAYKYSDL